MNRARARLAEIEQAAAEYLRAVGRLDRARARGESLKLDPPVPVGARVARDRAELVHALERRLDALRAKAAGAAARPEVAVFGRSVSGKVGRVDADAYGGAARGGSIHLVKSLTSWQRATGVAFGALSEFAAAAGGGGPQLAERVDLSSGRDGSGVRLRAVEAQRLVNRAEIAALSLGDLVGRYGVAAAPASLREAVRRFLSDETSGGRRPIRRLDLVRGVCRDGLTLSDVLAGAGWSVNEKTRKAAALALGEALDAIEAEWGGEHLRFSAFCDVDARAKEG